MASKCLHEGQMGKLSPPSAFSKVYKDECTLCFDSFDDENGLDVCLACFNGSCAGPRQHSIRHYRKTGHCLVLNIKREFSNSEEDKEEEPAKVVKVEIKPEKVPKATYHYRVKCLVCQQSWSLEDSTSSILDSHVSEVVKAIIESMSAQKRVEIQSWQEEALPCDHLNNLKQDCSIATKLQTRENCAQCELKTNLWMCLVCGSIGCGRRQFDGSGGNGHGASHFEETGHVAAVKLGTITAEGTADVHCYLCNEMRVDPLLSNHLTALGLNFNEKIERTEKTMAELQLEQNLKFDFSMIAEDGSQFQPIHGPHLVGLQNLGNSCYLSSVIQSLFNLPVFQEAYCSEFAKQHLSSCQRDPAQCFICQALKLETALAEGKLEKIAPWMFKAVTTSGHAEFSTTKQQDASEFISYFLKVIQRSDSINSAKLNSTFSFKQQQLVDCKHCDYQTVSNITTNQLNLQVSDLVRADNSDNFTLNDHIPLDKFLEATFGTEEVNSKCDKCGQNGKERSIKIMSCPKYLVITFGRYILRDWIPQKIELLLEVPFNDLDLEKYVGVAKHSSATLAETRSVVQLDEASLAELVSMGFPLAKCKKALIETGNSGLEAAMNWIFEHEGEEVPEENSTNSVEVPSDLVQVLVDAGFTPKQASKALVETNLDIERAFDWILSHPDEEETTADLNEDSAEISSTKFRLKAFISHKGPSVHCGHYIAHIYNMEHQKWIMFNDERVVIADPQPPINLSEQAYIFIYERQDP